MSENMFAHSADVEMWLDCGEYGTSKLSRISPKSVVLRHSFDAPAGEGKLIVRIDGKEIIRRVMLSRGASKKRGVVTVYPIDDVAAPF